MRVPLKNSSLRHFGMICFLLLISLVVFYGLNHSLNLTLPSLENHTMEFAKAIQSEFSSFSAKNSTSPLSLHSKVITPQSHPPMTNGGVIFFYHLYKCGGITIRAFAKTVNPQRVHFRRLVPAAKSFDSADREIRQYFLANSTTPQKILFVEHHGEKSILDMAERFSQWRDLSAKTQKPLFLFTAVREPVALAVSYFNFFHVAPGSYPYVDPLYEPTEANLIHHSIPNHALRMMIQGGRATQNASSSSIGISQIPSCCQSLPHRHDEQACLWKVLDTYIDWVGTTEDLSHETLPLLSWLIQGEFNAKNAKRRNVASTNQTTKIELDKLSMTSRNELLTMNNDAATFWRRVPRMFTLKGFDEMNKNHSRK